MSIHQHGTIEDTMYFWFGANDTSGSGADGASAVFDVRLAGGAADLVPVVSGSATLLTHANFPPGCYEIAIVAGVGTGTGFAANATYSVFCTLLVDSQNPTGFVGSFTLTPLATASQVNNIGSGATGGTHVEATYDNTTRDVIVSGGTDVDKGGGLVGIPVTGHAFVAGREVTIANTVNYNGAFEVISQTVNEVVITATYVGETFGADDTIVSSIKGEIFVGTITGGTFANVDAANESTHDMDDDTNVIKIAYGFNVGGSRQGTEAAILANLNGNNAEIRVKAWDFVGDELDDRGKLSGSGGSSFVPLDIALLSKHTGTAASELGDVFIFFDTESTSPSSLSVDECLLTGVGTNLILGYPNGFEILASGESGTRYGTNGIAGNPCPYADALTMNVLNPLNLFHVRNGETVTLTGNSDNFSFTGEAWNLVLNDQSIVGMHARGAASVTGGSTGSGSDFHDCDMGTCTIAPCDLVACRFTSNTSGGFTMQTAGDYLFDSCRSRVAGNASPVLTFPASGNTFVNDRAGSGGRQYEGMSAGDVATVEGWGQFIEGTCSGGAVTIRGCLTTSGITNITITDEARFDVAQITGGAYSLDTDNNGRVRIVDGTGAGEINTNNGAIVLVETTTTVTDDVTTDGESRTASKADVSALATSEEVATVGLIVNLVRQDTIAILLDTDELQGNQGDWATADVAAALEAIFLHQLFAADYDPASKPGVATALLNELIEDDGSGVSRFTVGALARAPSGSGGDATEAKQDAIIATLGVAGAGLTAAIGADSDTHKTLSDQIDGIVGGTGTGARTVAVTVNDGAAVLENASVRFTEGANTYAGPTDASGEISFSLDDATYAVAVSKPSYTFTPTTLVVDGDKTPTYSMTAVSITAPPNAATTTGVMTVYDEEGSVESGVTITVQVIDGPGTAGIGYDSTEWAATSNGSGVVEFAGIILGARYKIWRGTSKPEAQTFTAPTTGTSFDLAEVIGRG